MPGCLAVGGLPAGVEIEAYAPQTDRGGEEVMGYGILRRLPGLWHGPVSTTTPAGSFDSWYVDFRPISPGHISQYSLVGPETINYLGFFIVRHEGQLKVAMRTEGVFQGKGCVTYEVITDVREDEGYYRFADFNAGDNRAYTEFRFSGSEMLMEVYTNKFNTVSPLEIHCRWQARSGGREAAATAISDHAYPQPEMVRDFTDEFQHRSQSIYFDLSKDPYPADDPPYLGSVTVNIAVKEELTVEQDHEYFLLFTTESLFDGLQYKRENLRYISKYVYLPPGTEQYTFTHVHPGSYYLYAYNDVNGDRRHRSGDYMSSDFQHRFTLEPEGAVTVDTEIDFVIP
jgi:hypothetical protein